MEKKTNYLVEDKIFKTHEEAEKYAKILFYLIGKKIAVVPTKRSVTHMFSLDRTVIK